METQGSKSRIHIVSHGFVKVPSKLQVSHEDDCSILRRQGTHKYFSSSLMNGKDNSGTKIGLLSGA